MDWECKVTVRQSPLRRILRSRGLMVVGALFTLVLLTHGTLNLLCWLSCHVVFKA
ncbi:hypothetical protein LLR08_14775 [Rouxiella badensis]|jgi:hypothetical protein|uniref:hypothetical protein n=1 Tax=Rouxiella badensis TaxID=1646377 RepID=UPI001301F235|nr:hypothetical protein [Rouxiella badensis]MCC3703825.1 hypothetical protein [Rouxiella badensis]WAT06109.1 hypothetical protein O1V64_08450 [Rouxiella badensis]